MSLLAVVVLISLQAFLALVTYLHNPQSRVNRFFVVFVGSIALWSVSNYLADNLTSLFWTKMAYVGAAALFLSLLLFTDVFPDGKRNLPRAVTILAMFGGLFVLVISLATTSVVSGIEPYVGGVNVVTGSLFPFVTAYYLLTFLPSLYLLWRRLRISRGDERRQLVLLLAGLGVGLTIGLFLNLVIPIFTDSYYSSQFGPFSVLPILALTSFAIIRYKLFDIKVIATEAFVSVLIFVQIGQLFFTVDTTTFYATIIVLLLTVALSYFLIRSMLREVAQREQLGRLSAQLEKVNAQLKDVDEQKSDFVSIASHQLRTPLTVIKGYLSMIMEGTYGKIPEDQQGPIEKTYISANQLIELVENLLSVSRIESGRLKYNMALTSLVDMTQAVFDLFTKKAKDKGLRLEYNRPKESLPELVIDEEKIRQVMQNLVDNAVKYTKKGSVIISVRLAAAGSGPHIPVQSLVFEVKDTGLGVRKDDVDRLFQKFIRGQGSSLVHTEGTGLGLYVGRMMIEAHGGTIWVESRGEGLGSTFAFSLPIGGKNAVEIAAGKGEPA